MTPPMKKERKENLLLKKIRENRDPIKKKNVQFRIDTACALDDLMQSKGISPSDLAKKLGKYPSEISKWLSGNQNFTQEVLLDIAHALDFELEIPFRKRADDKQELNLRIHFEVTINVEKPNEKFIPTPVTGRACQENHQMCKESGVSYSTGN